MYIIDGVNVSDEEYEQRVQYVEDDEFSEAIDFAYGAIIRTIQNSKNAEEMYKSLKETVEMVVYCVANMLSGEDDGGK